MKKLALTLIALSFSSYSYAIGDAALPLQKQWAIAKYQINAEAREKAFKQLSEQASQIEQQHPNDAEVLVWEAVILSTYAGEKGGLGALGLVKRAKVLLERAQGIDGSVLNGSAYTSLGSLYYQVPSWPIAFGSDKEAKKQLLKGLEIAPNDIDANYFYGDFLLQDGQYREAATQLKKALNAPARPGREIADSGRREEIKAALEKAKSKI